MKSPAGFASGIGSGREGGGIQTAGLLFWCWKGAEKPRTCGQSTVVHSQSGSEERGQLGERRLSLAQTFDKGKKGS